MHDRWSKYHMSREILQLSARGVLRRLPGPGIGDRQARYGVSLGLSDLGGSGATTPSISLWGNLDQSRCQLVAFIGPYGVGGCWRTAIVRANMREIVISMLET